jgi:hypothetical protein
MSSPAKLNKSLYRQFREVEAEMVILGLNPLLAPNTVETIRPVDAEVVVKFMKCLINKKRKHPNYEVSTDLTPFTNAITMAEEYEQRQ